MPTATARYLLGLALGGSMAAAGCASATHHAAPVQPRSVAICSPEAGDRHSSFELVVVGSGGPRSFGRAASSYLIFVDGKARILVDVGPGAFVRLGEMAVNLEPLDTVLLTHLHIDHSGDLPGFVKSRDLTFDEPMSFRIFGPSGAGLYPSTTAFVDKLFGEHGAFAYLPSFRNELHFSVTDLPIAAAGGIHEVLREADLHVTSIAVDHDDVPAVAFRIEHAGHAIVVSGDLASKDDNLAVLAAGADLLVYDTAVLDPPESPKKLYDLHTPPRRIGEIASEAKVRSLLLSHIPPAVDEAKAEVLRSVKATFTSPTQFAEDCLRIDVTKG